MMKSSGYVVAISASPYSEYLIKWTNKKALEQDVRWYAVHIQKDDAKFEDNENLKRNMNLVVDLGGELITTFDDDIADGIIRVAHHNAISHIVIGKPLGYKATGLFKNKSIIDSLIRKSGELDIFVISEHHVRPVKKLHLRHIIENINYNSVKEYLLVTLILVLLVIPNLYLNRYISYFSIGFILLSAVSVISSIFHRGAVLYFAAMSAVLWNFLFLYPHYTFFIAKLEDLLMFLMYFFTAFIIGNLTTRLRKREFFLRRREKVLEDLYRMSRILNSSDDRNEIIENSITFLHETFSLEFAFILVDEQKRLSPSVYPCSDFILEESDMEIAQWCFNSGRAAGSNTDVYTGSNYHFMPMTVRSQVIGICVIKETTGRSNLLTLDKKNLLFTLFSQISSAIERYELNKSRQIIRLAEESEKMYQILLNSVSHELRTPITTITNAGNGLTDTVLSKNDEIRQIFINDIIESSDRLNRVVDNLLGSLKIESCRLTPNLEWYDISDLVNEVIKKLAGFLSQHDFQYSIAPSIQMVKFDFSLMDQMLTNILYNAVLYTPSGSRIYLSIEQKDDLTIIIVSDNGPGISESDKNNVFKKFYRSKNNKKGGLGLGLSICREIAEIHRGTITLADDCAPGSRFIVSLPLEQSTLRGEE